MPRRISMLWSHHAKEREAYSTDIRTAVPLAFLALVVSLLSPSLSHLAMLPLLRIVRESTIIALAFHFFLISKPLHNIIDESTMPNSHVSIGSRSPTSYYNRSPRKGFLARCYKKLKHLLKKMKRYMKSHPLKVFMLVIMPLLSGGILTGLLARFGIRLPHGIEKFIAKISGKPTYKDFLGVGMSAMGTGVGRDRYGEPQFERKRGGGGALDSFGGIGGVMDGVGGIMSVAKMFI